MTQASHRQQADPATTPGTIASWNQATKLVKYRLLRHLPGALGNRYKCKYMLWTSGFEDAVRRSGGMTCIDLGANVGVYTRKMASGTKRVIAFEPDPWTVEALEANVADLNNVRIEKVAAGTSERTVLLYRHARFEQDPILYSESSSVIDNKNNIEKKNAVEVRQINFIRYLEDIEEEIGILKIDIEGAEVDLLEALFDRSDILRRINYIFAETHEGRIPGHKPRVRALRTRAFRMERPYINLFWR